MGCSIKKGAKSSIVVFSKKQEAEKKKDEEEEKMEKKEIFLNEGYKAVLRFIQKVKEVEKENELIEKKIDELKEDEKKVRSHISSIMDKYGTEANYLMIGDYCLRVDGPKKVVSINFREKTLTRGKLEYKGITEYIPESDDGFRKEKFLSYNTWEFTPDPNADWEIPEDIKSLLKLYEKAEGISRQIWRIKQTFKRLPDLEDEDEFTQDMYMVAYSEYLEEKDLVDRLEGYWCVPYETIEEFVKKLIKKK